MHLEKVHNFMPLGLQIRVALPQRGKTMEVLRVVLAKEIHYEMDAILGFVFLNFLR